MVDFLFFAAVVASIAYLLHNSMESYTEYVEDGKCPPHVWEPIDEDRLMCTNAGCNKKVWKDGMREVE